MTEDEAKTKWCPMVRLHVAVGGDVWDNKPGGTTPAGPTSALCIGSACMMWVAHGPTQHARPAYEPGMGWGTLAYEEPAGGRCGLAK